MDSPSSLLTLSLLRHASGSLPGAGEEDPEGLTLAAGGGGIYTPAGIGTELGEAGGV